MRGDGATGEDNQAVRVLDEIGDNAARLGEALGGPVRGAVRIDVADGAGIGDRGHDVHFRPRALPGFVSVTRGISCDCSQS